MRTFWTFALISPTGALGPYRTLVVGGAKVGFEREAGATLWRPPSWHHAVPCHRHDGMLAANRSMLGAQLTRHWVYFNALVGRRTTLSVEPQSLIQDTRHSGFSVYPRNQPIAHATCIVSIARQLFL